MSLASRVSDLAARVAAEFKSIRTALAGKRNTADPVPLADLSVVNGTLGGPNSSLPGETQVLAHHNPTGVYWGLLPYAAASHTHAAEDVAGPSMEDTTLVLANDIDGTYWVDPDPALFGAQPAGSYAAASHNHAATGISDSTTVGRSVLTAANAAAARTAIGAGTSSLAIGTTGATAAAGNSPGLVGRYVAVSDGTVPSFTPFATDEGRLIRLSSSAAITVNLPQNSYRAFPVGGHIDFVGTSTGLITFVAGAGATVDGTPSLTTRAQWSTVTVIKISTDGWLVVGDLA